MADAYPVRSRLPEARPHLVRLLGTGAADPTVEVGPGLTATRTGAGAVTLKWDRNPGTFVGLEYGLGGAIPGYSVAAGTYDASTHSLPITIYDATQTAADLAAAEYVYLTVWFTRDADLG